MGVCFESFITELASNYNSKANTSLGLRIVHLFQGND